MMILRSSMIVFHFHSFMNRITTLFFTLPTMIPAIQKPTAWRCVSIPSNHRFGHVFVVLHTWRTVQLASLLVTSISMSSTMKSIYGHRFLARRSIDLRTGASSTSSAQLLSTSFSGTLQWQPSVTSLRPTLYSNGWTKCPTLWPSTLGNPAKCVTIVWPIQTTFATMITHVSFTAILLNALSSSCNSLRSGNICRMHQQRNSMMLRNISAQR